MEASLAVVTGEISALRFVRNINAAIITPNSSALVFNSIFTPFSVPETNFQRSSKNDIPGLLNDKIWTHRPAITCTHFRFNTGLLSTTKVTCISLSSLSTLGPKTPAAPSSSAPSSCVFKLATTFFLADETTPCWSHADSSISCMFSPLEKPELWLPRSIQQKLSKYTWNHVCSRVLAVSSVSTIHGGNGARRLTWCSLGNLPSTERRSAISCITLTAEFQPIGITEQPK